MIDPTNKKPDDIYALLGKILAGFLVAFFCVAIICGIAIIIRATF